MDVPVDYSENKTVLIDELEAARIGLAESLDTLGDATRSALDVPAKIKRNPVKTAALVGGTGFLLVLYTTFQRLFLDVPMGSRPLFLLAILMILIGIQFIVIGLLGEMQIRTYYEAQNKPIYIVRDTLGWEPD